MGGRYRALRTRKPHASVARSVCVRSVKARGVCKQPTAVPWSFMSQGHRVAVVGATGQVGSLMLRLLREREFPAREVVPFASPRSAGRVLEGAARTAGTSPCRARRGHHPGLRPRAVLRRRLHLGRVGAALRRRGRRGGGQLLALAHARRRAAGRRGGQPRRARRASRHRRQPQLLDDADGRRAEAPARRRRDRAARDLAPTRRSPAPARRPSTSCSTSRTRCCTSARSSRPAPTPTRSPSTRSPTPARSRPARTTPTRSAS